MTRRITKSAAKRPPRASAPLPRSTEPEMPAHLRMLTLTALSGTLRAPIGSSLPQIYLAAARSIIDAAINMQRGQIASDFLKAAGR